ncbi:MAG: hypothetical protein HYT12_02530 [Candidatus Liptonbacteria bacterium]|nr:hypothetical protein [Candidatus Liptonbacteria bacterium]
MGKQLLLPLCPPKHGDVAKGYTFYMITETDLGISVQYLGWEIEDTPIMAAASEEQFATWHGKQLVFYETIFTWTEKPFVWKDLYHLDTKAHLP